MKLYLLHNTLEGERAFEEAFKENEDVLMVGMPENPVMCVGNTPYCNEIECGDNSIDVFHIEHRYGPILTFPGDLSAVCIKSGVNNFGKRTIDLIVSMLREKGVPCIISGNDVLAEGEKVASWYSWESLKGKINGVQCSINTDVELVKKMCKKQMIKTPGKLCKYNVSAKDIWTRLKREGIIDPSLPEGEELWQT